MQRLDFLDGERGVYSSVSLLQNSGGQIVTPSMRWVSRSRKGTSCLMIVCVTSSPPACSPHSRAMRLASATVSVATVIVLCFHVYFKQT